MAIFKCKMCGGQIIVQQGAAYGICDSCGAKVDLGYSYQEREQMRRQEIYQRQELSKIEEEKESIKEQLSNLGKLNTKKKCNIIQLFLSAFIYVIMPFAVILDDSEFSDAVIVVIALFGMLAIMIAPIFIIKYSDVFNNVKGRIILIIILQYFTVCMFGIVVGVIDIIKIIEEKKNAPSIQAKLQKRLNDLLIQEEFIKNNFVI